MQCLSFNLKPSTQTQTQTPSSSFPTSPQAQAQAQARTQGKVLMPALTVCVKMHKSRLLYCIREFQWGNQSQSQSQIQHHSPLAHLQSQSGVYSRCQYQFLQWDTLQDWRATASWEFYWKRGYGCPSSSSSSSSASLIAGPAPQQRLCPPSSSLYQPQSYTHSLGFYLLWSQRKYLRFLPLALSMPLSCSYPLCSYFWPSSSVSIWTKFHQSVPM